MAQVSGTGRPRVPAWVRGALVLWVLYVAVLAVAGSAVVAERRSAALAADARRLDLVAADARTLQQQALDQREALRAPVAGTAGVAAAWAQLQDHAAGAGLDPDVARIDGALAAWDGWVASPRATADLGTTSDDLLAVLSAATAALDRDATAAAAGDEAGAASLSAAAQLAAALALVGGPVGLVLAGAVVAWRTLRPVRRLARVANRLAGGLEDMEVPHTRRRDDIGVVARALVRGQRAAVTQRLIWQHSPIAMLTFGADLVLRHVNPADLAMFGYDDGKLLEDGGMATAVAAATHPDDAEATARMYRRLMSGRSETERLEKRYIRRDGSVFWGSCTLTLIRDEQGRPDHYVCMIEDISDRREKLEQAAQVQRDLLPASPPDLEGYELAGLCRPSEAMGGDFYDWRKEAPGTLTLTVGDVMGKGMPAALLMATLCVALRASGSLATVGDVMRGVVGSAGHDLERVGAFVTLFHGRLDLATGELRYVDAGHGLLVVAGHGGVLHPRGTGLPLGVTEEERYEEASLVMQPGDALVVFSDGVLDVHPDLEEGLERVEDLVAGAATAAEMAERLANGPGKPADDVTVVVLRRLPVPASPAGSSADPRLVPTGA